MSKLNKFTKSVTKEAAASSGGWFVVDASGQRLGRLATILAHRLKGKHRVDYTPHVDLGDNIIVINADKITVTGRKEEQKTYYRHSGYPGGLKSETFSKAMKKSSEKVLRAAVHGMLPKNRLGRAMLLKLRIYGDDQHPHAPQQPETLTMRV